MDTACFDYELPAALIAQHPVEPRDAARLLVAGTRRGEAEHRRVADLDRLLLPGDLLVLNHTRVFPARLLGTKDSGGALEVLLLHREDPVPRPDAETWRCYIRGRVRPGMRIDLGRDGGCRCEVVACDEDGARLVAFPAGVDVHALAERIGHIPLPPYIRRPDLPADRERYQTVFAETAASVAAPTAGLHLTRELLARLAARGVACARVDLAIGPGTFKPVSTERIEDHAIHAEHSTCPAETVAAVQACRARGGRVVAVGTTAVRALETAAAQPGGLAPYRGWTRLFLHPPARLRVVDGLLTNFHLPRSSLLMLVSCLTGVERLLALYRTAIGEGYRFYSYGDAMLLLPDGDDGASPDPE